MDCDDLTSGDAYSYAYSYALPASLPVVFAPERLVVLTDGLCGSTCATFVARLQERARARVVGVGGLKWQALQSQSFAGGFVTTVDALNALLAAANESTIPEFPTTAVWQLAWGELYSATETEQPMQFANLPTEFNLDYWDYDATSEATQIALYELAVDALDK